MSDDLQEGAEGLQAERLAALEARLNAPVAALTTAEAIQNWRWADISLRCDRPKDLESGHDLADRIRGAWGRALGAVRPRELGQRILGGRVTAWDLFFGRPLRAAPLPSSRPYVIEVESGARHLDLRLRLIGLAAYYCGVAEETLVAALEGGIALHQGGRQRRPLPVLRRQVLQRVGFPPVAEGEQVKLELLTPLVLRREGTMIASLASLPGNLLARLRSLARWQDFDLVRPAIDLNQAWSSLQPFASTLAVESWPRHSRSSGARAMPIRGLVGSISYHGNLTPFRELLAFGLRFHAGSAAAHGMGRFSVIVY